MPSRRSPTLKAPITTSLGRRGTRGPSSHLRWNQPKSPDARHVPRSRVSCRREGRQHSRHLSRLPSDDVGLAGPQATYAGTSLSHQMLDTCLAVVCHAVEKVANTQGTYHDFPRTTWDSRALKPLTLV